MHRILLRCILALLAISIPTYALQGDDDLFEKTFATNDANSDGKIELEEVKKAGREQRAAIMAVEDDKDAVRKVEEKYRHHLRMQVFLQADANDDYVVTKEEYREWYDTVIEGNGKPYPEMSEKDIEVYGAFKSEWHWAHMLLFDKNKDKLIDDKEFAAYMVDEEKKGFKKK